MKLNGQRRSLRRKSPAANKSPLAAKASAEKFTVDRSFMNPSMVQTYDKSVKQQEMEKRKMLLQREQERIKQLYLFR